MRDRQPGSEPQSGDRVPYILIDTGDPKAKAYEKSEDPKYAKDNNLKVGEKVFEELHQPASRILGARELRLAATNHGRPLTSQDDRSSSHSLNRASQCGQPGSARRRYVNRCI